jgi:hypothetical protein
MSCPNGCGTSSSPTAKDGGPNGTDAGSCADGSSPPCPPPPVLEIVDRRTGAVVSGTTVTKIVGQKIELLVRAKPSAPLSNIQWTVPAKNVKSYTQSLTSGTVTVLAAADLQAAALDFYWIEGGNKTVQVGAVAKGNNLTANVTFNVLRPTVNHFTTSTSGVNLCVGTYFRPGTWMVAYKPSPVHYGCQWDAKVTAPAGGDGQIGFTQRINYLRRQTDNAGNPWKITSNGVFQLDGDLGIQYKGPQNISAGGSTTLNGSNYSDSPGNGLSTAEQQSSAADSFELYLMYKPGGLDSIWVTLAMANWSWAGQTTRIGAPASPANNWNAVSGASMTNDANGADTTSLPTWTGRFVGTWVAGP